MTETRRLYPLYPVNKIEIRNQEQCDKEAEIYSQTSGMRREICDHEN